MKRCCLYAVVLSGLVGLSTSFVLSAAQDLRTTKQMQEFVSSASTAADHTQLSKHFLEMAAQYRADAETHTAMALSYRSNPGPPRGGGGDAAGAHCDRLARQAREAATTATELAIFHERLAAEGPESDAQAPTNRPTLSMPELKYPDLLTAKQAQELVASAKTPADHVKLGKHFAAEAARYTVDANSHVGMAAGYRGNPRPGLSSAADHCDRLIQQMREAAAAARALATYHEQLAKSDLAVAK